MPTVRKMTLLTGNKQAMTFFEVMVAVVILAGGIVVIYKSLIKSLDAQGYLLHRLYAHHLMENALADLRWQPPPAEEKKLIPATETFDLVINNKRVSYRIEIIAQILAGFDNLIQYDFRLSWEEPSRTYNLYRTYLGTAPRTKNE